MEDIKYITISEDNDAMLQQLQNLNLLGNKHDLWRAAVLIGLKIDPNFTLDKKQKSLISRSENKKAQNISRSQVDESGDLAFIINQYAPDEDGHTYRKMQSLIHLGLSKIREEYIEDGMLDWKGVQSLFEK